jgi:hypothetical protein
VDIPAPLYEQLKDRAAASGLSVDELLVEGAEKVLVESQKAKPYRVKFPLIDSDGPKIDLTNERMYEEIEFP